MEIERIVNILANDEISFEIQPNTSLKTAKFKYCELIQTAIDDLVEYNESFPGENHRPRITLKQTNNHFTLITRCFTEEGVLFKGNKVHFSKKTLKSLIKTLIETGEFFTANKL